MACGINFHGDQLRLTSFLRVADNIPQRPSRLRKHALGPAQSEAATSMRSSGPDQVISTSEMKVEPIPRLVRGRMDVNSQSSPRQTSAHLEWAEKQNPDSLLNHGEEHTGRVYAEFVNSPPSSPIERPATNTACVTDDPPREISSTQRRRFPINELFLIRTTTIDGLPERSDGSAEHTKLITDIDPIEESRTMLPEAPKNLDIFTHPDLTKSSPPLPNTAVLSIPRPSWKPMRKLGIDIRLCKVVKTTANTRSLNEFGIVADGFTASELAAGLKTIKTIAKRSKSRAKRNLPTSMAPKELSLASGQLPNPIDLDVLGPCSRPPRDPLERTCQSPLHNTLSIAAGNEGVEANITNLAPATLLSDVLASVTAPERDDSDSDAEDVQFDGDGDCYLSDDTRLSSISVGNPVGNIVARSAPFIYGASDRDHGSGDGAVLNYTAHDTDDFWAHYNGLD